MKLGDLKIIHIIIALALILWGVLFFDNQWNKRMALIERNQIVGVINDLNNRMGRLEGMRSVPQTPQAPQPSKPKVGP